jgi:hypothetical protein
VVDFCKYHPDKRCYYSGHCGIFDCATGSIGCCGLHPNPSGRFHFRLHRESFTFIFSRHGNM